MCWQLCRIYSWPDCSYSRQFEQGMLCPITRLAFLEAALVRSRLVMKAIVA